MDQTVLSAFIQGLGSIINAAVGTAVGAVVGAAATYFFQRRKRNPLDFAFVESPNDLKKALSDASSIKIYSVNSYELYNTINGMLQRDHSLRLNEVCILVRRTVNESPRDLNALETLVDCWKKLVVKRRIDSLKIVAYDHDPDHYYTILGDNLVFVGHVLYDPSAPTGTSVDFKPMLFNSSTAPGRDIIKKYNKHFENHLKRFENEKLIYDSTNNYYRSPQAL